MSEESQALAAAQAADTVAKAAQVAAQAVATAAITASSTMNVDIGYIKRDLSEIKQAMKEQANSYVTQAAFWPVKMIVYSGAGIVLTAVVGAVISMVVLKH